VNEENLTLDMFNNKAQKAIDSERTITIDTGSEYSNNITMNSSNVYTQARNSMISSHAVDTLTIGNSTATTYTISDTNATGYGWADSDGSIVINTHAPVDFTDCLPDFSKIQAMCAEYPGLDKAFDNFKMTYKMVHQDWLGKKRKK